MKEIFHVEIFFLSAGLKILHVLAKDLEIIVAQSLPQ